MLGYWLLAIACCFGGFLFQCAASAPASTLGSAVAKLQSEVHGKGWIAFGARSSAGDWDLFLCRPDGTELRPLTRTPGFNEHSPQFSRDGRKLLYRRVPRQETIDNNRHGEQGELVLANADGGSPVVLGKPGELTWASFSPDGLQLASLSIKGVAFIDLATRRVLRTLPRCGFFQQMTWSPDGKWLIGVANSFGASWSIARMEVASGKAAAVNRVDCCTPDWFPDSREVIFSWRPPGQKANNGYGWTQLWRATADGASRQLVYGEDGRHVYGGQCVARRQVCPVHRQPAGGRRSGQRRRADGPDAAAATRRSSAAKARNCARCIPKRRTDRCSPCRPAGSRAGPLPNVVARRGSLPGPRIHAKARATNGSSTLGRMT